MDENFGKGNDNGNGLVFDVVHQTHKDARCLDMFMLFLD